MLDKIIVARHGLKRIQNAELASSITSGEIMIFFNTVRVNCSRLISHSLFFLLVSLVTLAQPLHSKAQETQNPPLLEVQPFGENTARRARRAEWVTNVGEVARSARFIYVRSHTALVTTEDIENKLRKHPDFQRLGLIVTRREMDADLILEVRRSVLTKFVFTAIEPETLILVASGKLSSLGGTVDAKVARLFMKQLVAARVK